MDAAIQLWKRLYGPELPEGKRIGLWWMNPEGKRPAKFYTDYETAARQAMELDERRCDVFFRCGLVEQAPPKGQRGDASYTKMVTFLWADVDFEDAKGSGHPADEPTARNAWLNIGDVEPSIVVNSGRGRHLYWLLDEPLTDMDVAAELTQRWEATLGAAFASFGWKPPDKISDLARVLRVPGTHHRKDPDNPLPVEVIGGSDTLYSIDAIKKLCLDAPEPTVRTAGGEWPSIALNLGHRLSAEVMAKVQQFDAVLHGVLTGTDYRGLSDDPSSMDMSVARRCYDLGLSDQQAADAIIQTRVVWGFETDKLLRRDYIPRTLARARESSERERYARDFGTPPPKAGGGERADGTVMAKVPHAEVRKEKLKDVREMLQSPVAAVRQIGYGDGKARFEVELDDGRVVRFGRVENFTTYQGWVKIFVQHNLRPPAKVPPKAWPRVLAAAMDACELYEIPEQAIEQETGKWLRAWLRAGTGVTSADDRERARQVVSSGKPVRLSGELHIACESLTKYVRISLAERVEQGDMHSRLKACGFEATNLGGGVWSWSAPLDAVSEWLPEDSRADPAEHPDRKGGE